MSIDRLGRCSQAAFDSLDQLLFVVDPLGRKTNSCWCTCGSLGAITDQAQHTTKWQHDLEGRFMTQTYPDGYATNFTYDSVTGRLATSTDALGQVKTFSYNLDDSPQTIVYTNSQMRRRHSQCVMTPYSLTPLGLRMDGENIGIPTTLTSGI